VPLQATEPKNTKPPTLIVANEDGLRELRYDGSEVRALSKTPARMPRFLPGGKDLLFYVRATGEIRKLSLETRAETVSVRPPPIAPCTLVESSSP